MNTSDSSLTWPLICKATLDRAIRGADFLLAHQMADILLAIHPHDVGDAINSPIAVAANMGRAHAFQYLLDEGFNHESFAVIGSTLASSIAPEDPACYFIAKRAILLAHPSSDELGAVLHAALCEAANDAKLALLLDLLAMGAPTEPQHAYGAFSPLSIAAEYGHAECLRALAKAGAAVDYDTGNGWTPLVRAIKNNRAEIVRELLAFGANPAPDHDMPHGFDFHGPPLAL